MRLTGVEQLGLKLVDVRSLAPAACIHGPCWKSKLNQSSHRGLDAAT